MEKDISPSPAGHLALHSLVDVDLPYPVIRSYIADVRRTVQEYDEENPLREVTLEYYPASYAPENSLIGHLRFALSHEPCDLAIIYAALRLLGPDHLAEWINKEPTSAESRRAWFFYETLTGETIPIENTSEGNYVDALSEELHYVSFQRDSPRHRVRDNLLGTRLLCPILRRTPKLEKMRKLNLSESVQQIASQNLPEILNRAENYLMARETLCSFAIEGESLSHNRKKVFLAALRSMSDFNPREKPSLLALQNAVVETDFAAQDWRDFQNFIGETIGRSFQEKVHFVCPRPEDVPGLMDGWMALTNRLLKEGGTVDAVMAAAVSSFVFVFIHPFENGNGRVHHFLMHYMLREKGFTPPDIFLPISASILKEKHLYDSALEAFSKDVMKITEWNFTGDRSIIVENETLDLFRFADLTTQAEFLYDRVETTIRHDLKEEVDYLVSYDNTFSTVQRIVQLPDRRINVLVRLLMQNKGHLSKNKKRRFPELNEGQINEIEKAVAPFFK